MLMLIAFSWDILILLACWDSDPMVVKVSPVLAEYKYELYDSSPALQFGVHFAL